MSKDSDAMPMGDGAFTPDERQALRRVLRDEERSSWAWKRLRVLTPMVVGVMVALWQAWDWVAKHVRLAP